MNDEVVRPVGVVRPELRGLPAAGPEAAGDPPIPPHVLELMAAGGRLRGLVLAVEPARVGEWMVRLRLSGQVVQVRSRVPVEVGAVREFQAVDLTRPRVWTVVTRGTDASDPRLPGASPGARLGDALRARSAAAGPALTPGLAVADATLPSASDDGSRSVSGPAVLRIGPAVAGDAVRAAFAVFGDVALLGTLLHEVVSAGRSSSTRLDGSDAAGGDPQQRGLPAAEALRALGSGVVEFGRVVEHGSGLVPIPVPFERVAGLRELRCYVARDRDQASAPSRAGAGRSFLVVLLLELSALGALRVDVDSRPGGLAVRFATAHDAVRAELEAQSAALRDELASALDASGQPVEIEVAVAASSESTALLRELDRVDRVARGGEGLDVHA